MPNIRQDGIGYEVPQTPVTVALAISDLQSLSDFLRRYNVLEVEVFHLKRTNADLERRVRELEQMHEPGK